MKLVALIALVVLANFGLFVSGESVLVFSATTDDHWNRKCVYYSPIQTFDIVLPLSQNCPRSVAPG